jgi:aminomethyltransferase
MLSDRRAAREGDCVQSAAGDTVGIVTSGSFAPSVGNAVALAYVDIDHTAEGSNLFVRTERQALPATVMMPPFYRDATARAAMNEFLEQEEKHA